MVVINPCNNNQLHGNIKMKIINHFKLLTIILVISIGIVNCSSSKNSDDQKFLEPEIIATGAKLAGANGMALGPDGNLYVASVLGSNITVLNPETGKIIKEYGQSEGVIGPDDVDFASDGSWYWTSIMTGEVAGFNKEGKKIIAAQLTPGVNPITFSNNNRLFVSQCFFGSNLYEVDPLGITEPRLISDSLGPDCGLNGMDWGPDNRLYGPRWFNNQVVSFDVSDNSMRIEATGFITPAAIKFDKQGRLHVLDTGSGILYRIENGKNIKVAELSPGLDNFVIDSTGRFFVSSFTDGFVKRIDLDGSVNELLPGGMAHSGGITFHNGKIITADLHAIRAYFLNGKEAFTQRNVLGMGAMGGALNISSDGEQLILVSWVDNDVRIWDQEKQQRIWEKSGLNAPVSAIRYADQVVVAEHGSQRIVGFSQEGNLKTIFASNLPAPTGLLKDDKNLYVSDRTLGQIILVAVDGLPLAKKEVVIDGLTTPEGFVKKGDTFFIVEADLGVVTSVNLKGKRKVIAKISKGSQAASPMQPPSQVFNGITIDDKGALYVPGESDRALYKITNY